jgi:hypothetical protein
MYSSSLHIFDVLLQHNVDIMSLNHNLMYVVETINYFYLLFQLIIFSHLITFILINLRDNIMFFHLITLILINLRDNIFFPFEIIYINLRDNI